MGIRFYCPQGHKLNVKSFLAGKTGFCPFCNARVEIPLSSTRESSRVRQMVNGQEVDEPVHDIPLARPAPIAQPAGHVTGDVPVAKPVMPSASSRSQVPTYSAASPASPAYHSAATPAEMATPAARPAAVPVADPISEAPHAVWYVTTAAGGQYGPAAADVMRQWLAEGRVAADSLVWREGWPDWRQAATTFPGFFR